MKFLRLLILALTAGVVFSSCQKELSAETGSALGVLAKDAAGDCAPIGINGAYKQDTVLNATNFVDIQLDVTQVGIYIISTDTVNGYYFRATGVTPLPGANTIRLVGFGKPLAVGTDVFTVKFGGTVCEFNVPVTLGTGGGGGTYTLDCASINSLGIFNVGTPVIGVITLTVNSNAVGSYTISTNPQNGVVFSSTGTLAVGNNTINLTASSPNNIPTSTGPFTYTIAGSSCTFSINYSNAPVGLPGIFACNVNGVPTTFNQSAIGLVIPGGAGATDLKIIGFTNLISSNEAMAIDLSDFQTVPVTGGIFTVNSNTPELVGTYSNAAGDPFIGEFISGTTQTNPFKITILTNTATRITGTFEGELEEDGIGTTIKTITLGVFDVPKG